MKKKNIGIYLFYLSFIVIMGVTFYISGMYKKEKLVSSYYLLKRFGNDHRYVIQLTKDLDIKLTKISVKEGKVIFEEKK